MLRYFVVGCCRNWKFLNLLGHAMACQLLYSVIQTTTDMPWHVPTDFSINFGNYSTPPPDRFRIALVGQRTPVVGYAVKKWNDRCVFVVGLDTHG